MSTIKQNRSEPWQVTASTTMTATGTVTGDPALQIFLTDLSASTDSATTKATTLTVASGGTTIWKETLNTLQQYEHSFVQPIQCTPGATLTITLNTTPVTALANVNAAGFKVHLT